MPSTERFTLAIAVRWKAYECMAGCQLWVSSERSATMDGYMEQMWMRWADVTEERLWRSKNCLMRFNPAAEVGSRDNTSNLQSFSLCGSWKAVSYRYRHTSAAAVAARLPPRAPAPPPTPSAEAETQLDLPGARYRNCCCIFLADAAIILLWYNLTYDSLLHPKGAHYLN